MTTYSYPTTPDKHSMVLRAEIKTLYESIPKNI